MVDYRYISKLIFYIMFCALLNLPAAYAKMNCNELSPRGQFPIMVDCQDANGWSFKGWLNQKGQKVGKGENIFSDGSKYIGEYLNNKRHGQGTYFSSSGWEYVGNWVNDKYHGHGTYYYKENGRKFVGKHANGERHGQGTQYYENGDYSEQEYSNGVQINTERYFFRDGEIREFTIINGKRSGFKIIKSQEDVKKEEAEKERLKIQRQKEREANLAKENKNN